MKTRNPNPGGRRGAVATILVLMVAVLMVSLVIAGANSTRRARRAVNATGDAQAKHWARVSGKTN